jgi:hypothetical protein
LAQSNAFLRTSAGLNERIDWLHLNIGVQNNVERNHD